MTQDASQTGSPGLVRWLSGDDGEAVMRVIAADPAGATPGNVARWRERFGPEHASAAIRQVELRRRAVAKFSLAARMLFDEPSLEQASGEAVARHKARRFAGRRRVVDLCCGIGGDALAFAAFAPTVVVDRDAARTAMAVHNARCYGHADVAGICADVTEWRPAGDAFHIDPSRREGQRRRHGVDEADPPLAFLEQLVRAEPAVCVKLSPAVDFARIADFDAEIEMISEAGECKQAVAWCGSLRQAYRRATMLPSGTEIRIDTPEGLARPALGALSEGVMLVEPDAAIIRAGLVGELARRLDLRGIDSQLAYLVGERPVERVYGMSFRVMEAGAFSLPHVRRRLRTQGIGRLDIKTRGFAAAPEALAKRLGVEGDRHGVLVVTRIGERPVFAICERA